MRKYIRLANDTLSKQVNLTKAPKLNPWQMHYGQINRSAHMSIPARPPVESLVDIVQDKTGPLLLIEN